MRALALILLPLFCLVACDHERRINYGARIALFDQMEPTEGHWQDGQMTWTNGYATSNPETIHVAGAYTDTAGKLLHEFVHVLVERLDRRGMHQAAQIVQLTFRDLCGPGFELGRDDLLTPLL